MFIIIKIVPNILKDRLKRHQQKQKKPKLLQFKLTTIEKFISGKYAARVVSLLASSAGVAGRSVAAWAWLQSLPRWYTWE
jgi:hypothetical protein